MTATNSPPIQTRPETDEDFDRIVEQIKAVPCDVSLNDSGTYHTSRPGDRPCPREAVWIIRLRPHCDGDKSTTWLLCDWHKDALFICTGWCDHCGVFLPSILPWIERIEPLRSAAS